MVRVLRKIVRGLSAFHHIATAVPDDRVLVDVLDPPLSPELLTGIDLYHAERDVIEYWFDKSGAHPALQSMWFLRLFERRNFVALVARH